MRRVGLDDDPFDWRATKDGQILISRGGRVVTVVRGRAAAALTTKLHQAETADAASTGPADANGSERDGAEGDGADGTRADAVQQLLARATGNYRRGNERTPTRP